MQVTSFPLAHLFHREIVGGSRSGTGCGTFVVAFQIRQFLHFSEFCLCIASSDVSTVSLASMSFRLFIFLSAEARCFAKRAEAFCVALEVLTLTCPMEQAESV